VTCEEVSKKIHSKKMSIKFNIHDAQKDIGGLDSDLLCVLTLLIVSWYEILIMIQLEACTV
jgi:hypothetical protein